MAKKVAEGKSHSVIGERLAYMARGQGLQEPNISRQLGSGLCRLWGLDPKDDPERLRVGAIGRFERLINGLLETSAKPHQTIARISYNIAPYPELRKLKNLTQRRQWLAKPGKKWTGSGDEPDFRYGTTRHHWDDDILPYLEKSIAAAWRDYAPDEKFPDDIPARPGSEKPGSTIPSQTPSTGHMSIVDRSIPFIERPQYQHVYEERLARGDQVIPFAGEPGNGKSRLADYLIEAFRKPSDTRLNLRAHERVLLRQDIARVLESRGVVTLYLSDNQVFEQFALYLSSDAAPSVVFIDNLEESALYERLVPPEPRSRVVITGRENRVPAHIAEPIVVGAMYQDEAEALARWLLPNEEQQGITQLAITLGGRPLAIEHVCTGLLRDGFMSVDTFCRAFERNASKVLRQTKPADQAYLTLTWIYEQILIHLRELDEEAGTYCARVLELIACLAPIHIPARVVESALWTYRPAADRVEIAVDFQAAIRDLSGRYLIARTAEVNLGTEDDREPDVLLAQHPLTQLLLRSIIRNEQLESDLCAHLLRPFAPVLADHFYHEEFTGEPINTGFINLLPHLYRAAAGLKGAPDSLHEELNFGDLLAVLIRGFSFIGYIKAAQFVLSIYPNLIDEAKWASAPHMHEAYADYLKLRYALAEVDRGEYARLMYTVHMLNWPKGERKLVTPPRPMRFLDSVEAMVDNGRYSDATDMLESLFSRWYPTATLRPAVLIRRTILLAEIYQRQCRWEDSTQVLDEIPAIAATVVTRLVWGVRRNLLHAVALQVDNAILSNRYDRLVEYQHQAEQLWSEDKPSALIDSLSEARYYYIKARCSAMLSIKTWLAFTTDTSMRTRENADRLVALGKDALDYGRSSANAYASAGDARHAYDAYPYVLLALRLSGQDRSTVATMFAKVYQDCGKYGSLWAQMQMWIIMEKLRLPKSEPLSNIAAWLEGQKITETSAWETVYVDESPYLYAEMLGMSAIYDKLLGVPNKGKLEQIRATYIDIGREDRWDVLTSALESLPDDMQSYTQHIAYMLLP